MTSSSADLSWLSVPPHPQPTDRTARKAKNVSKADGSEIVLHEHLAAIDLSMLRRSLSVSNDVSNERRYDDERRRCEVVLLTPCTLCKGISSATPLATSKYCRTQW
jgi:hypothetical protein